MLSVFSVSATKPFGCSFWQVFSPNISKSIPTMSTITNARVIKFRFQLIFQDNSKHIRDRVGSGDLRSVSGISGIQYPKNKMVIFENHGFELKISFINWNMNISTFLYFLVCLTFKMMLRMNAPRFQLKSPLPRFHSICPPKNIFII